MAGCLDPLHGQAGRGNRRRPTRARGKGVKILVKDLEFSYVDATDPRGADGQAIAADPKLCARIALHMIRASYRRCGNLSGYTSGHCQRDEKRASVREWRAKQAFAAWKIDDSADEEGTKQ